MRPVRLAVIFDQKIEIGGGYQQAINAALLVKELPEELVQTLFFTTLRENIEKLAKHGIQAKIIHLSFVLKASAYLRRVLYSPRLAKLIKLLQAHSPFEKILLRHNVDLVYFLSPSYWAADLEQINYITTVWDLCHRDDLEFPEVREGYQFENREQRYRSILPKATAVFVDSDLGKVNVIRRYGIDEERIHVMPFQAAIASRQYSENTQSEQIDICVKYKLNVPYVFYPAQFWAHKNHVYLLDGLKYLEQRYNTLIGAIFSGGDQGNLLYVKEYVKQLELESRIRFIGFVDNEEIPLLYRQSVALVMPTYFGPTNLPPLEAFCLGVPVLYPDKVGLRDQVGDAALLLDLTNPGSMADQLKKLLGSDDLRDQLIEAGRQKILEFNEVGRVGILRSVIENFRWRRLCWK